MNYEQTGSKKIRKSAAAKESIKNVSTGAIIWALVKRHKFALVSTYAVVITLLYLFPMLGVELGILFAR